MNPTFDLGELLLPILTGFSTVNPKLVREVLEKDTSFAEFTDQVCRELVITTGCFSFESGSIKAISDFILERADAIKFCLWTLATLNELKPEDTAFFKSFDESKISELQLHPEWFIKCEPSGPRNQTAEMLRLFNLDKDGSAGPSAGVR